MNHDFNLEKKEILMKLGKVRKDYPDQIMGLRPSQKNQSMSNLYNKYFEEISSYGVSLVSLNQVISGYFYDTVDKIEILEIIKMKDPDFVFSKILNTTKSSPTKTTDLRNRKRNLNENNSIILLNNENNLVNNRNKLSLDFITNKINFDSKKKDNFRQFQVNYEPSKKQKIYNKNFNQKCDSKFCFEKDKIIPLIELKIDNNLKEIEKTHLNQENSQFLLHPTFSFFKDSPFKHFLKGYSPSSKINLLKYEIERKESFNVKNLSVYYNKKPVFFHLDNTAPDFKKFKSDTQFLNFHPKELQINKISLKLKFLISSKTVSIFYGSQLSNDIKCSSKVDLNFTPNSSQSKSFETVKIFVGDLVVIVPILINPQEEQKQTLITK